MYLLKKLIIHNLTQTFVIILSAVKAVLMGELILLFFFLAYLHVFSITCSSKMLSGTGRIEGGSWLPWTLQLFPMTNQQKCPVGGKL